ncbi:MAG: 2Fe-2S iron-sulfur cluster-binding protein [Flavobacteriales bacterium]
MQKKGSRYHDLKVLEVKEETPEAVSITLEVPDELKETFQFNQGQYLTFKKTINNETVHRNYSICTTPNDDHLKVAVKKVKGGIFSTFANEELKKGDILSVMPPKGRFYTPLSPSNKKSYLAVACGSGITPVISIIKTVLETEKNSEFTLFYGNKDSNSIIFKEELQEIKDIYLDRFSIFHVLSREQTANTFFSGRIDAEKFKAFSKYFFDMKSIDDYFLCGPEPMINSVSDLLKKEGIDEKQIHYELFTTANSKKAASTRKKEETEVEEESTKEKAHITLHLEGSTYEFDMPMNDLRIVDAARKNGIEVPFSCKGGMCSTCVAMLKKGEVEMDVNYALNNQEIEKGLRLTCQSHPLTKEVEVNYDED